MIKILKYLFFVAFALNKKSITIQFYIYKKFIWEMIILLLCVILVVSLYFEEEPWFLL